MTCIYEFWVEVNVMRFLDNMYVFRPISLAGENITFEVTKLVIAYILLYDKR